MLDRKAATATEQLAVASTLKGQQSCYVNWACTCTSTSLPAEQTMYTAEQPYCAWTTVLAGQELPGA